MKKKIKKGKVHVTVPLNMNVVLDYKRAINKSIFIAVSFNLQLELHTNVTFFGNILCYRCMNVFPIIFYRNVILRERGSGSTYTIPALTLILPYIFLLQIHPRVHLPVNLNNKKRLYCLGSLGRLLIILHWFKNNDT